MKELEMREALLLEEVPETGSLEENTRELGPQNEDIAIESASDSSSDSSTSELEAGITELRDLVTALDDEFAPIERKMKALLLTNHITYDLLWRLFPEGSEITFKETDTGLTCAGLVQFHFLLFV
jgi:hypothetical protein